MSEGDALKFERIDEPALAELAARLAPMLAVGGVVFLIGDLGAGKTTLVTGLVAGLGGGAAASPTFALVNEYPGGRLVVWHVDLYRIERAAELPELGLDDVIGDPRGICVVEWADRFAVLPPDHLRIELAHAAGGRSLAASGTGPRGRELAAELVASL
jgi:tRNA threonylcarbamoyladenosine biosynthesis protein TsaE